MQDYKGKENKTDSASIFDEKEFEEPELFQSMKQQQQSCQAERTFRVIRSGWAILCVYQSVYRMRVYCVLNSIQ